MSSDLHAQVLAIAEATPPAAIQTLLKRYMPTRPVSTRRVTLPDVSIGTYTAEVGMTDDGELTTESQPNRFKAKRGVSKRRANQRYEWIGRNNARFGTFREYMLRIIRAHTNTSDARKAHSVSGEYFGQTVNFKWAEREGYIRFVD